MGVTAPTPPRVPRQRRAFSTVGGAVEVAGDPVEGRALGALWDVDPGLARALTHGFHAYAGRMHPSIARGAIARWSRPGDLVVDPFCGSGTVLVEAMAAGRLAIGVDASPLGVAIAETRTTLLGEAARAQLIAEAARIAEEAGENARRRRRPEIPGWARREFERFFPHVAFELFGLRALVMATPRTEVGRALRLCFSTNLVKLMKAGPEAPRDGADKRIARGVPSRLLSDRAVELARSLAVLERRTPAGTPPPRVRLGDARDLGDPRKKTGIGTGISTEIRTESKSDKKTGGNKIGGKTGDKAGSRTTDGKARSDKANSRPDGNTNSKPADTIETGSVRLIVSSPPYAGTYDYAAQHDVRFAWLELPRRSFEQTQIGARAASGGFGADPGAWRLAQTRWLGEMGRILAPGGYAMLVVGDGVVGQRPEDGAAAIAALSEAAGLTVVARASQVRATHDRRLREIFAGQPRREHLLLLRKRGGDGNHGIDGNHGSRG